LFPFSISSEGPRYKDPLLLESPSSLNQIITLLLVPLLLAPKILPFPKELGLHFFSIFIQEFLSVSTPFFETSKHEMDKFLLLGTHTRKRIMVALPLSYRDRILNLLSSCLIIMINIINLTVNIST
jgi:hypothetical protein